MDCKVSNGKGTFPITADFERLVCFLGANKVADQQLVIATFDAVQRNGHHCLAVSNLDRIIAFSVSNNITGNINDV